MDFFSPEFLRARYTYDPETGVISNKSTGRPVGFENKQGYIIITIRHNGSTKSVLGHRAAWQIHFGCNPADRLDHRNNDRADNKITNLRECTQQQNVGNYGAKTNNTSGYRGVTWSKHRRKWVAQIGLNKGRKNLGGFDDPAEAYKAYCRAASEYYGEFFDPSKGQPAANDNSAPRLATAS